MMNARFIKLVLHHLHRVHQAFNLRVTSRNEVTVTTKPVTAAIQEKKGTPMKKMMFVLGFLTVTGCSVFENDAARSVSQNSYWTTGATFTTPDVRLVMQRKRAGYGTEVVCAEPGADVAKAI